MKVTFYLTARSNIIISKNNGINGRTRKISYHYFEKTEDISDYQPCVGWKKRLISDEKKFGTITRVITSANGKSLEVYVKVRGISEVDNQSLRHAGWTQVKYWG